MVARHKETRKLLDIMYEGGRLTGRYKVPDRNDHQVRRAIEREMQDKIVGFFEAQNGALVK